MFGGARGVVAQGERTTLRFPQAADKAPFQRLRRANDAHLSPWSPSRVPARDPCSDGDFAAMVATAQSDSMQRLLICERSDGAVIGVVTLSEIVRGAFQNAYLGYWLDADHQGRGYMTEALKLALGYAFEQLELHRVEANIMPSNRRSVAVVERLGFRKEGLSLRYLKLNGQWRDHERWALTVEDWATAAQ